MQSEAITTITEAKSYLSEKVNENTAWVKQHCGNKKLDTDFDWNQISKLNYDVIYTDYPKEQRMAIAIRNMRFVDQVEGLYSDLYDICQKDHTYKDLFNKIQKIKFNVANTPSKKGSLYSFAGATGTLTANISIYEISEIGSDQLKQAFMPKKTK